VATTLNNLNLGTVLGDLAGAEVARAAFEEALRLYQPFLSDGPAFGERFTPFHKEE
jgi:hypothetical protein